MSEKVHGKDGKGVQQILRVWSVTQTLSDDWGEGGLIDVYVRVAP